jgi:hypothetical protein
MGVAERSAVNAPDRLLARVDPSVALVLTMPTVRRCGLTGRAARRPERLARAA